MKKRNAETGSIATLFMLALLAAMLVGMVMLGKPYYRSYTLGSHTRDFLKSESGDLEKVRLNVIKDAAELGILLNAENLTVTMDKQLIKVRAKWNDTVDFWGYYQTTFDFEMNEEY